MIITIFLKLKLIQKFGIWPISEWLKWIIDSLEQKAEIYHKIIKLKPYLGDYQNCLQFVPLATAQKTANFTHPLYPSETLGFFTREWFVFRPIHCATIIRSILDAWVTFYSFGLGNSFALKGLFSKARALTKPPHQNIRLSNA
jgi:hypothetical protein